MKIGLHSVYDVYNHNDAIFDPSKFPIGDGLEEPFVELREVGREFGHVVTTLNVDELETYDAVVLLDISELHLDLAKRARAMGKTAALVVLESQIIVPENWDPLNVSKFDFVFSWNPVFNAEHGCVDLPIAQKLDFLDSAPALEDRKFSCMVAGNKFNPHPSELYSARRNIIRWYERHARDRFDLYGLGWDNRPPVLPRIFRRVLPVLDKIRAKGYPSYKGTIDRKRATISNYQFNFCLENVAGIPGYHTEKIFDAIAAGCVPVYSGDANGLNLIPGECWIDFSEFDSIGDLDRYLVSLSPRKKAEIQACGREFLRSEKAQIFSTKHFAYTIASKLGFANET